MSSSYISRSNKNTQSNPSSNNINKYSQKSLQSQNKIQISNFKIQNQPAARISNANSIPRNQSVNLNLDLKKIQTPPATRISNTNNNIIRNQPLNIDFTLMNYISQKKGLQQCKQCGLRFQSVHQLVNHQRKFCVNSGYNDLKSLLMKQTRDQSLDFKVKKRNQQQRQLLRKMSQNKMKNYGELSLSKIKYSSNQNNYYSARPNHNRDPQLLFNDMKDMQHHRMFLDQTRPYIHNSKISQKNQLKKNSITQLSTYQQTKNNKILQQNRNASILSYLPVQTRNNKTIHKNQSISPASNNLYQSEINLVHVKQNPASIQFMKKYTVLNRSDASIVNMADQQKITYAKLKLDQLKQIKEQYLRNGGQSKQFKRNVQNMIAFYQKLINQCCKSQIQTQLSIASRPQTPIHKLDNLKQMKKSTVKINKNNQIIDFQNNQNYNNNSKKNQIINPYNPYAQIGQNYAHFYHLKIMQDMMRLKSQQNRKLIEALIQVKNDQNKQNKQNNKLQQAKNQNIQNYRFAQQNNPHVQSEDRILKMLQQEELDQLKLLSKLPMNLQDQKIQSIKTNSQLRHKMQKQVLKQKLEKLNYQQKIQTFEQQRTFKNENWAGKRRKDLIKNQMKQYLQDFSQEFQHKQNYPIQ